jgi:hypothetical protein
LKKVHVPARRRKPPPPFGDIREAFASRESSANGFRGGLSSCRRLSRGAANGFNRIKHFLFIAPNPDNKKN